jgi:hypothetical protein
MIIPTANELYEIARTLPDRDALLVKAAADELVEHRKALNSTRGAPAKDALNESTLRVWCLRNGVLGFGHRVPKGALTLGMVLDITKIQTLAMLAHDGKTWLVPGVPEADNDQAALEAVRRFVLRCTDANCIYRPYAWESPMP